MTKVADHDAERALMSREAVAMVSSGSIQTPDKFLLHPNVHEEYPPQRLTNFFTYLGLERPQALRQTGTGQAPPKPIFYDDEMEQTV
jgi:hypothetical protein